VDLKYGNASEGLIRSASFLKAWGALDLKNMSVDLYKLSDALVAYNKSHKPQETLNFAQSLGLDQPTLLLLLKGSEYLRQNHEEFAKLNEQMNKNAEISDKLNEKWVRAKATLESWKQTLYGWIAPALLYKWGDQWAPEDIKNNPQSNLPRNLRNNNPGNLEYGDFAKSHGATGSDGRFAIFSTMEAGMAAQEALLRSKYSKGLDTIHKLYYGSGGVKGWLGSGADLKDADSAIKNVMRQTGIGENQRISPDQLAMVRQAMQNNEGMIGARTNAPAGLAKSGAVVSTNIQNVNVQTQATDANGIAKDMKSALQQNTLINAGIMGAD
jgi:hypothetical protein